MRTLLVSANPEPNSLTAEAVRRLEVALQGTSVESADLHAEGFDPRFTLEDRRVYSTGTGFPADVRREQRRLDAVTDLVLVFPVYWWSMPALLKGWVDRVFVNGWAFDATPTGIRRNLQGLTIHLLPIAGDDAGVYDRHGYEASLRTQIEHGIVDYCGARRGASPILFESEQHDADARGRALDAAVAEISGAILAVRVA